MSASKIPVETVAPFLALGRGGPGGPTRVPGV